jgi:hypothetical protein
VREIEPFLAALREWAESRPDLRAVAVIGSHARF